MSVFKKLLEVQARLEAPKGQFNSFGKYKYRSCEDIMEAVKPLLKEVGAIIVISDNIEFLNGRFYVHATAKFIDVESGKSVNSVASAREADDKKGMDSAQVTGATSSYARKYALNGLLAIDDIKDADRGDPTLSPEHIATIKKNYTAHSIDAYLGVCGVTMLAELPHTSFENAIQWLQSYQHNETLTTIRKRIAEALDRLQNPNEAKNSVKKHLGCERVKDCSNLDLLNEFYAHTTKKVMDRLNATKVVEPSLATAAEDEPQPFPSSYPFSEEKEFFQPEPDSFSQTIFNQLPPEPFRNEP